MLSRTSGLSQVHPLTTASICYSSMLELLVKETISILSLINLSSFASARTQIFDRFCLVILNISQHLKNNDYETKQERPFSSSDSEYNPMSERGF